MLFVRLQKDLPTSGKPSGIPDDWPAEVEEVKDGTADPKDGRLVMKDAAELASYKASLQDAYDAWYDGASLPLYKERKFVSIDKRTGELIAAGFTFAGKQFSLSTNAQNTFTGLYAIRDEPALSFPVKVNTLDDDGFVELTEPDDVRQFYLTAVSTYRAHLDAGTALKDAVRAATTSAELDAIKDPR